jgi:hypothetical protein
MTVNKERKEGREEQQDKLKIKSVRSADNRSYNFLYNEAMMITAGKRVIDHVVFVIRSTGKCHRNPSLQVSYQMISLLILDQCSSGLVHRRRVDAGNTMVVAIARDL